MKEAFFIACLLLKKKDPVQKLGSRTTSTGTLP
jgi:hypothetical protein